MISANLLFDSYQKFFAYQLLTLPNCQTIKYILPISLRQENENSQPRRQCKTF